MTRTRIAALTVFTAMLLAGCSGQKTAAASAPPAQPPAAVQAPPALDPIVGSWQVKVTGAPYQPHLFAFLPGGVMLSTNPTDVQAAGKGGTNDSVGFGRWEPGTTPGAYVGTFVELNADARSHKSAPSLLVTYRITIVGDKLTGSAQAGLSDAPTQTRPATFTGTRVTTDAGVLATVTS